MHAPFVCSSIQPYSPVAIEVLFYLVFMWGGASPPLCGGACHTLGAVRRLLLSKHTGGGGATPVFSGWLVYLQFMWGSTPPPSLVELSSRQPLYKLSPLQGCWRVLPLLPSLTCLFIYSLREGVPLPLSPELRVPHSLCYVSFFSSCLFIIQFFFPGLVSVCPVGYADLSQGVLCATNLLTSWSASLKQGRSWCLAMQEPSWFLHLMWRGDAMCRLGVWRCRSFASSWWFSCQVYLQHLSKSLL
jgi:hypothetical protein